MDVLLFVGLLTGYIWLLLPLTGGQARWDPFCVLALLAVAVTSVRQRALTRREMGLTFRDFLPAVLLFLSATLLYAGAVLAYHRHVLVLPPGPGRAWPWRLAWGIVWALMQEFCLLSFLLARLRRILGRSVPAAVASAAIFAFFHLPNPFLTAYAFGGSLIAALLFLRWPSLPAATLAHALASALVGSFLPELVTASMQVGPAYFWVK